MKCIAKAAILAVLAAGIFGVGIAEASNLDTYRNLIIGKRYTIKYTSITPEERVTNKNLTSLTGSDSMGGGDNDFLYKPLDGVIVSDGDRRYEEIGYGRYANCRLQEGTQVRTFPKSILTEKPVSAGRAWLGLLTAYAGAATGGWASSALSEASSALLGGSSGGSSYMENGPSFASVDVTRLLNAMLPDGDKTEDMTSYQYVTEGWLPNGMNYVDYKTGDLNNFEAIRYYFDEYTLVKIVSAQFATDEDGRVSARRNIIHITEFSPTPDEKYVELLGWDQPDAAMLMQQEAEEDEDE